MSSNTLRRSDFTSRESALLKRHPLLAKRRTLSAATPPSLPASAINASAAQAVPGPAALTVGGATLGAVQGEHARADGQSSVAQARKRMRELAKAPAKAELPQLDEAAAARAVKTAGHTAGHTALQSAALELLTADNECGIQTFTGRTRAEASSVYGGDTNLADYPYPYPYPYSQPQPCP